MADVLTLKDGSVETLFEPKDFQYLVEKYMGYDAETYFRTLVEELQGEKRLNKTQMGKLLSKMEKRINNQI